MSFTDHFGAAAADYAAARPTYPDALFAFIAERAPARGAVWDCGTGSGQAARGLARYFARVVATDASREQLAHAGTVPGVEYRMAAAEQSGLDDRSMDAVAVANAVHWFDAEAFHDEARRVLVPGGLVVEWGYASVDVGAPAQSVVHEFEFDEMGPYWPPQRALVITRYATIPFPFRQIDVPSFKLRRTYTLDGLLGYVSSWSATAEYRRQTGRDPLPALKQRLAPLWGPEGSAREARWGIHMRAGYAD